MGEGERVHRDRAAREGFSLSRNRPPSATREDDPLQRTVNASARVQRLVAMQTLADRVHDAGRPAQRYKLPTEGSDDDVAVVDAVLARLAGVSRGMDELMDQEDRTLVLLVQVERSEGEGGNANTHASYNAANMRTFITVHLQPGAEEGAADIEADLIHEMMIHALPAVVEHATARDEGRAPAFPEPDTEEMEAAEEREHEDIVLWKMAILAAIDSGSGIGVVRELIRDSFLHLDEDSEEFDDMGDVRDAAFATDNLGAIRALVIEKFGL